MEIDYNDLSIPAPWGKVSVATWGSPSSPPVLLMHGRQDSAATFVALVRLLPTDHYYVAVDLPGHGRSDPYPKGLVGARFHYVHTVDIVVKHMGWKKFVFIGHSMGCEIGLFYNAANPGRINAFILLDPGPTFQRLQQPDHVRFYKHYYARYYGNYKRYNGPGLVYTKRKILDNVMKGRQFNEEQAEVALSRNLVQIGDDKYRLTTDSRSKYCVPQNFPNDYYIHLFTNNAPPTLITAMSHGSRGVKRGKEGADELLEAKENKIRVFKRLELIGGHDHHVTHPEELIAPIEEFLREHSSQVQSKL
ncbi:serine hydrolase-like protein [Ostrinia furnacalis]|uniref:serine hydrolase-like protein n=1 Tax=Ostrinia furnacalis TaxID=93504 RepID=UPI00103C0725|nr:serine hydrolase-like protein [Ostrinia furnacalis]